MKLLKVLFAVLIFFTPIIYVNNTNELYEFPKMFFVYLVGATAIMVFLLRKLVKQEKLILPSKPVIAFMLIYVLATLFSMHLYTSVWGYYTRFNGGLMSMAIFFGLYLVALNDLSKEYIKQLFLLAYLTLIPIGIYSAIQHFSFLQTLWGHESAVRTYSTFGQPNWLAAYVAMLLPFALYFYFKSVEIKKSVFWLSVAVLGFSTIWFSYSMSGLLGFSAAFVVLLVMTNYSLKKSALFIILCLLVAVTNLGVFQAKLQDVFKDVSKKITLISTVYAQTDNALSDPGFIRLGLWEGTLTLITSSPKVLLLGTGPETFPYAFQPFRTTSLSYSSEWDFVFNKPHNYYLELVACTGIFGLAAYLALIIKLFKTKHRVLVPSMIALVITNMFGWPTVAINLLFWLYIAYAEKK